MNNLTATWHHLRRSPFQSLAALVIMSLTFFTIFTFVILSRGLSSVLTYFETKPEITIFLKDGLDQTEVEGLQKEISLYSNIKEIRFISKENALNLYRQQNLGNPLLTEMVTASILPASFEISVTDPKVLKKIYDDFTPKSHFVEEIIFQQDIVDSIITWSINIKQAGLAISATLLAISFFVILIIIGMKITNHKDEIKISRLLGASKFYVQKPFLTEGLFYGFFGGCLGSFFSLLLGYFLAPKVNQFFNPITFVDFDPSFYLLLLFVLIFTGSLVGYFSSWLSVRRFIKF